MRPRDEPIGPRPRRRSRRTPIPPPPAAPPDPAPRLIDARAVAERLGVSPRQARYLARRGWIPGAIRLGGVLRWDRAAIDAAIARLHAAAQADPPPGGDRGP